MLRENKIYDTIFSRFLKVALIAFSFFIFNQSAIAQVKADTLTYTVKPGDYLIKISKRFGDSTLWRAIYKANSDRIKNPDMVHPGQKLIIPLSIRSSKEIAKRLDEGNPNAKKSKSDNLIALEKFRKVFEQLVKKRQKEKPEAKSIDYGIGLGGLVINETRTKMGNNFYNVFYKYWQAPKNTDNFLLTITEQPMPSRGTLITVKIDHELVFKSRLQPRYAIIEKLAKQAVAISYIQLHRQILTSSQLSGY